MWLKLNNNKYQKEKTTLKFLKIDNVFRLWLNLEQIPKYIFVANNERL